MTALDTRTGEIVPLRRSDIERADQAGAALMVTTALIECRGWIAKAIGVTDPTPMAEFRAWAATAAEAARQKDLGREIELDALEMVRLAERGIGVAIRNGQEAGEIATVSSAASEREAQKARSLSKTSCLPKATDYVTHAELFGNGAGIYDLTDGVSDEEYRQALAEARDERNLSRANVVRKIKQQQSPQPPVGLPATDEVTSRRRKTPANDPQRLSKIQDMSARGMTSGQIADRLGICQEYVRLLARKHGIEITADRVLGRSRKRIDSNRIVEQTVISLEATQTTLRLVNFGDLDASQKERWASSLKVSIRALNRLIDQLKELTQ